MEDKKRLEYEGQIELAKKVGSVLGHPEWQTIQDLIEDERKFHANKAKSVEFRNDPSQYGNIVRAMDAADAVNAILDKFKNALRHGREAQEKLDAAAGLTTPKPR